jgi:phage shock protein A
VVCVSLDDAEEKIEVERAEGSGVENEEVERGVDLELEVSVEEADGGGHSSGGRDTIGGIDDERWERWP